MRGGRRPAGPLDAPSTRARGSRSDCRIVCRFDGGRLHRPGEGDLGTSPSRVDAQPPKPCHLRGTATRQPLGHSGSLGGDCLSRRFRESVSPLADHRVSRIACSELSNIPTPCEADRSAPPSRDVRAFSAVIRLPSLFVGGAGSARGSSPSPPHRAHSPVPYKLPGLRRRRPGVQHLRSAGHADSASRKVPWRTRPDRRAPGCTHLASPDHTARE